MILEGLLKEPFKITNSHERKPHPDPRWILLDPKGTWHIILNKPPHGDSSHHMLYLDVNLTLKQMCNIELLLLRRSTRQDWWHRHSDPTRNPYVQTIVGLALLKRSGSSLYERVGFFTFHRRKPDFLATNWFSDCSAQTIKIV